MDVGKLMTDCDGNLMDAVKLMTDCDGRQLTINSHIWCKEPMENNFDKKGVGIFKKGYENSSHVFIAVVDLIWPERVSDYGKYSENIRCMTDGEEMLWMLENK